ncbi:MAG: hypothetical protein IKQ05_02020 [Prevotella sp.]|nr:hypothetical protein [Prevotella sp.]
MATLTLERYLVRSTKTTAYGKTYARVKQGKTIGIRRLAQHIQDHGSIYTLEVISGVLAAAEHCIPELLLQGYNVKLEGLGTFRLLASSSGVIKPSDWTIQSNLKGVRIGFRADQSNYSEWTRDALSKKLQLELAPYVVLKGRNKKLGQEREIQWLDDTIVTNAVTPDSGGDDNGGGGGDNGGGDDSGGGGGNSDPVEERP